MGSNLLEDLDWDIDEIERACAKCDGHGYFEHDCGEDTCCCLDREPEDCTYCDGTGTVFDRVKRVNGIE